MRLYYITRLFLRILVMEKVTLSRKKKQRRKFITYMNVRGMYSYISTEDTRRVMSSEKQATADPFVHVRITCVMNASYSRVP
jgi:hypothetical protein